MAEYIEREAIGSAYMDLCVAKSKLAKARNGTAFFQSNMMPEAEPTVKELFRLVMAAPAADVAPVVRCKECKHWNSVHERIEHMECDVFCGAYGRGYPTNADDFCSYGERRSDN